MNLTPRWRKVLTDLWEDKTRTSLVVSSIAVGVFAIGMVITTFVILNRDISLSFSAVNAPNIEVRTEAFDDDLIRAIERIPGVEEVQPRTFIKIQGRRGTENWMPYGLVVLPTFDGPINILAPLEGTNHPGTNQVIVNQSLISNSGYHTGDELEIKLPDGFDHSLELVGLVVDQTVAKPSIGETNYFYITQKTYREFGQPENYNQLYITVQGNGSDLDFTHSVAQMVREKIEDSGRSVYTLDEKRSDEHPMMSTLLAIIGLLGVLGGLITLLSSSLIINTLNALLAQQIRQIGIMKLIGATSVQILGMYLTLIISYSLIALAVAIPLGSIAGYAFATIISNMLGAVLGGFRVVPLAILVQTIVAVFVPLIAGFFPVNSGSHTSVQQAISNYRPTGQKGRSRWFHINPDWLKGISRPLLLSFRNTFRKKGRLMLTIFTLTVAGAVFIAVFNVSDSLGDMMDKLMQHFMGDVNVTFRQPYDVEKVKRNLADVPGIVRVEGWSGASGEVWDEQDHYITRINISAPPRDTALIQPDIISGRWLTPRDENALVISDTIYETYPNLVPGDTILVKLQNRPVRPYVVVGVFRFISMLGDIISYGNLDYISRQTFTTDEAVSFRIITEVHDKDEVLEMAGRIDQRLTAYNYIVQSIQSGTILRNNATQAINVLIIFLLIMAFLTAIVGSIGLTGTMSINVLERTRELGVMRTIGAEDGVIMRSVILEGVVIGLITWVLAIAISFPISEFLLAIIGEAITGSPMLLNFTPLGTILWLAVVLSLSAVASIIPARNAAMLTINEVLAYE